MRFLFLIDVRSACTAYPVFFVFFRQDYQQAEPAQFLLFAETLPERDVLCSHVYLVTCLSVPPFSSMMCLLSLHLMSGEFPLPA
mmetsp:Transcript_58/g.117  ORF Transcript_58/g.117 Transcript_58/m.117 type:complete len:84 (+) Transcript_58:1101-1352(+)